MWMRLARQLAGADVTQEIVFAVRRIHVVLAQLHPMQEKATILHMCIIAILNLSEATF